jgi:co-chaperonin GroES (HSP10)
MSIKLFGHRVLLKHEKLESSKGNIIIPDVAGKHDLNRTGRVKVIGDGKVRNAVTGSFEVKPALVKEGDMVMFQINDIMKWAQIYRHGKDDLIWMLQHELIARINGKDSNMETFEILGDFVLVKPEIRKLGEGLVLPDSIKSPDMIHYTVKQIGCTVDLPISVGQEVICNHGRINPIFIPEKQPDGAPIQIEYGYVFKDFVHGMVDAERATSKA